MPFSGCAARRLLRALTSRPSLPSRLLPALRMAVRELCTGRTGTRKVRHLRRCCTAIPPRRIGMMVSVNTPNLRPSGNRGKVHFVRCSSILVLSLPPAAVPVALPPHAPFLMSRYAPAPQTAQYSRALVPPELPGTMPLLASPFTPAPASRGLFAS